MTRSRALPFAVVLVFLGVIFAGCSRSSLQGEFGLPPGSPCVTSEDCAGGATCDPSSQVCAIEDGGSDSGGDANCFANVLTDPFNCGACGDVCATGSSCINGTCVGPNPSCASGNCPLSAPLCCASGCADTTSDHDDCGACGIVCQADQTCINSECLGSFPPPPPACGPCAQSDSCCSGNCTDTASDVNNCGGCGLVCPAGTFGCQNGECCTSQGCTTPPVCNCVSGESCCTAGCTDTTSDLGNCGGCGLACPVGSTQCLDGQCCSGTNCGAPPVCNCSFGQTCCTTGCASTATDPNNCGGCAIVCPSGASCVNSACSTPPPPNTCNGGPLCQGGESCCATGCSDVLTDPANCGVCGDACPSGESCVGGSCESGCGGDGGAACTALQECCPSGCENVKTDPDNCGGCNVQCGATASCVDGSCVANDGAFDPIVNPTYLSPGVHSYTTINVPAGVTVYVGGAGVLSGTLDLHATGAIQIDGTIDVSGGPGTQNTITSQSTESGRAGGGGFTGEPYETAALSAACSFVAGNAGSLGLAVSGSAGTCAVGSSTVCQALNSPSSQIFAAAPGEYGGGAGVFTGYRAYGSGGGGSAGGAPGALGAPYAGEADCNGASGGGGAVNGSGGTGGGTPYDGTTGALGQTQCAGIAAGVPAAYVGGGGGGSIGPTAASDLAVTTTFQTGSAGGGGSADYLNRPVFGGTSGGGGGGGALKLETPATITITGQLLANGGIGGDSVIGTGSPDCNPQPGAAGGGGSGGVIYLSAPSITVGSSATITALGGTGGAQSEFATGGAGGAGGLGRIRISVTAATCSLVGTFDPPLASGCSTTPGGTRGSAYVGTYPN